MSSTVLFLSSIAAQYAKVSEDTIAFVSIYDWQDV